MVDVVASEDGRFSQQLKRIYAWGLEYLGGDGAITFVAQVKTHELIRSA